MSFGSNVPYLTERILTMSTEQRAESTKLIPTGIQFTPFLIIRIFPSCHIICCLTSHITVFHTETTNIHCPIRNTADGKIQACRNLSFHVFPTSSNIAAPCSGRIALQACKSRTGQKEHTLIRIHATLAIIDGIRIH